VPQVRSDIEPESVKELALDIQTHGILQPLTVRPGSKAGKWELIAGHRRHLAAKIAGLERVPCIEHKANDGEKLRLQLAENIHREDLSPADTAAALRKLYDDLGNITEVANLCHKSKSWVSTHLVMTYPEFGHQARMLFEDAVTNDIELLGIVSKIENLSWQV